MHFKTPENYVLCYSKCINCGKEEKAILEKGHNRLESCVTF